MTVSGGDIIYAADFNNILPKVVYKTATTTRTSTATATDDPDLSGITLAIGTYAVTGWFMFTGGTTPDIKIQWAFTGSFTAYNRMTLGPATATTDVNNASLRIGGTSITGGYAYGEIAATTLTNARESFILDVTASGDLSVQWAQNTSDGTGTQLAAGSYVQVIPFS